MMLESMTRSNGCELESEGPARLLVVVCRTGGAGETRDAFHFG